MEEPNNTLVQSLLDLDVQQLQTLDQCAEALSQLSAEQDKYAKQAVSAVRAAIMHGIKCGDVCLRGKEIAQHGEFVFWLEQQSQKIGRSVATLYYWMKMAKFQKTGNLLDNPTIKTLTDAYRHIGALPEPEPKPTTEGTGESDKVKLAWSPIKFSTRIDDWTKEQALDWLYEYDRMSQWARQLRMEFGLT